MPDHPWNADFPRYVSPEEYEKEQTTMATNDDMCTLHGRCKGIRKKVLPYFGPAPPPAPPESPPPPPDLPLTAPSSPPWKETVCDKPSDWCLHSGAHSKPKLCGHPNGVLVAGHWCTQGEPGEKGSLSGFSPCKGPAPAGSAWPHGICLDVEDGEALCPDHPHVKLSSSECPQPELQVGAAAPPQAVPKQDKPWNPRTQGATMAPYPTGPWQKANVGSPPGTDGGRDRGQDRDRDQ